jgi:hypothetical protein
MKAKVTSSVVYSGKFKDVKSVLPKLMLSKKGILDLHKKIGYLTKVRIGYATESSLNPDVLVEGTEGKQIITQHFQINTTNKEEFYHVGYRRSDDWLGLDGKLIHKSKGVLLRIEYLSTGTNLFKFMFYKFMKLFTVKRES